MRHLLKAMVRAPWSLAMAGLEQTVRLVRDPDGPRTAADALDAVSASAEAQTSGPVHQVTRAGDRLQSEMIDTAADLVEGGWREPRQVMDKAWGSLDRSFAELRDVLRRRGD